MNTINCKYYFFIFFSIFFLDPVYAIDFKEFKSLFSFHLLGSIIGYEALIFLPEKVLPETFKKMSFFEKAMLSFVEKYVRYIKKTPSSLDLFILNIKEAYQKKFYFRRSKVCKVYPDSFSYSIVGYDQLSQKLQNIINAFKDEKEKNFIHPGHTILYGPPGTGKTKILLDLLIKSKLDFVFVDMNLLKNKPIKNIPLLFNELQDKKTVFLMDEFDGFVPPSKKTRALNEEEEKNFSFWKTILDSHDEYAKNRLIFVTSNHKDYFDEALLRPGRLENHFEVSYPDPEDRLKIFLSKCWEYGVPSIQGLSEEEIKQKFDHYSGAKIDKIVRLLATMQEKNKEELSKDDFYQCVI
jgi:SpoVK/Ycf46/Vps4 family AAA+-type ATPase